jgi:GLPGLI family protein
MKKLTGFIVLVLISAVMLTAATDSTSKGKKKKKGWKGTITYNVSYDGENITPAAVANAPKQYTVKVMGDKSSMSFVAGMATISFVSNPEFDLFMQKIEFGDKKYAIKKKLSEIEQLDSIKRHEVTVDLVNETKMIAGYECKKAVVTYTPTDTAYGEEQMFNFYYSEDLGDETTNEGEDYAEIPGLLLEYSMIQGDMILTLSASEIKKGGVGDADFMVPVDFKVVTEEELEKELGQ